MSSEFERQLRDARATLPGPDENATRRAREGALAATRRRTPRIRRAVVIAVALVLTLGIGVGVGSLVVPSGTAAQGPVGLGFLPEEGWFVLQSGTDATPEHPAVAIASNVPLSPGDGASIVPYSTLLSLPADGIVMVANFTGRVEVATAHYPLGSAGSREFRKRELPLRIRDATPYILYAGQIRPDEPLGQYQLRAEVKGYVVDLHFYFGTVQPTQALLDEAQTQLDRLVVRRGKAADRESTTSFAPLGDAAPLAVLDRTLACTTVLSGGIREVEARAHRGYRFGARWTKLPYAVVSSGTEGGGQGGRTIAPDNSLAWVTAGSPAPSTTVDSEFLTFPVQASGTLGLNTTICNPSTKNVPLTSTGLRDVGRIAIAEEYDCAAPRRVYVRVRAIVRSKVTLRRRGFFQATLVPVREARLVVRTESGKPLVYAQVLQSGDTRLFTARGCASD